MELLINTPPSIAEEDSDPTHSTPSSRGGYVTSDSAIYVQGMNVLCAPFLYAARSEVEAFALFHSFVTRECPGYIRGAMDGVHRGLLLVDRCLEIVEPKLAAYLFSKGMQAKLYAFPSVLTLCACTPPLPEVLHLWDFLFAYGPHLNILCIVAQLIRMRDTILENPRYVTSFSPLVVSGTPAGHEQLARIQRQSAKSNRPLQCTHHKLTHHVFACFSTAPTKSSDPFLPSTPKKSSP